MIEKIRELLEKKNDLPPLPEVVLRLQKMIQDPHSNAKSIAKLIEVEPVLAGKILKLANSVYYRRSTTPVTTLPVAISKIGMNVLVKLIYSLKLTSMFKDVHLIDSTQFWQHSLAVALFTQHLSRRVKANQHEQDISYLSGLMHDIGISVFIYLIPAEYADFLRMIQDKEILFEVQEKEVFGIDHAELGFLFISKWWQVDDQISRAVRYHHFPFDGEASDRRCMQMVHVANGVCNNLNITNGIITYHEVFKNSAWEELNLSLTDVEAIIEEVEISLEQAKEMMVNI